MYDIRLLSKDSNNTLIGYSAGKTVSAGHSNVCLGSKSGLEMADGVNNICIGENSGTNVSSNNNIWHVSFIIIVFFVYS